MKNFVQPGNTVTVKAPKDLVSGEVFVVGKLVGVCTNNVKSGADCEAQVEGCVTLKRATGVNFTEGAAAFVDVATQELKATGTLLGYVIGSPSAAEGQSPDDPAYTWVKQVPSAV